MTKVQFDRIICFGGDEEQVFFLEDFAFQENIPFFATKAANEIDTLAKSSECSLFVFPGGAPKSQILLTLFQSGHAWWIWDKFPIDSETQLIQNWIHNQHGSNPFSVFCQNFLLKVSACLIPNFQPQIEVVPQIDFSNKSHCVFCEAPSSPFTFKVEVFYNHDKMRSHSAFQGLPEAFIADFYHELANQFLGRLNQSVQHTPFVPDIGVPKYMGFNINSMIQASQIQSVRVLFSDPELDLSIAVSAYSTELQQDPQFRLSMADS